MMQQANARRGGDKEALETRRRRHRSCKKARSSSLLILDETGNLVEMHSRNSTFERWLVHALSTIIQDILAAILQIT
jgi:hypothetical protein